MASEAVRGSVVPEVVQQAAEGDARQRLSAVVLTDSPSGSAAWRCQVYIFRCRAQGFMAVFPFSETIEEALHAFVIPSGGEVVALSRVSVELETVRGRPLGPTEVILADVPWTYLSLFRKASQRSSLALMPFAVDGTGGRPVLASVEEVASSWIASVLDEETAQEYATAAEMAEGLLDGQPLDPEEDEAVPSTPARSAEEIRALHHRVAELEKLLQQQQAPLAPPATKRAVGGQPMLFGDRAQSTLTSSDLQRLQLAAGPPPPRLGRAERAQKAPSKDLAALADIHAAEVDREVLAADDEEDPWLKEAQASMAQVNDPIQRMLLLQLKQTSDLVKALAPKQQPDPLSAVLGGTDNGSASSGGNIGCKGYAAREMFLKQLVDEKKLVQIIQQHAMTELGISRADGSLLRTFLEHRVPLSDRKTLTQMGYMLAWGWEAGFETQNIQLMAFAGRMMMYVEQCCLDEGRSGLAWLLTGLPEPNFQQLALNRKRTSLTPFSKLAPPTWVAANVSYLRDVEVFDTRLKQLGTTKSSAVASRDSDPEDKIPRPKPKAKGKKGKGGKGAEASSTETTAA